MTPGTAAGVVLAGGRSRRMGTDKAALPRGRTTLLGHVLAVLAEAVDGPLVVVGAADEDRALPGDLTVDVRARCRVVHDPVPDRGPLQGIATGLSAVADAAASAVVVSVDLPHLHPAFVRAVLAHRVPPVEVALPVLDGHRQPLLAAYATALGARATALLAAGAYRPGELFAASRVVELDAATLLADADLAARDPELRAARGVNTPEEYRAAGGSDTP